MREIMCYHKSKTFRQLVGLEYVLTWGYSKNPKRDERIYKRLSRKIWNRRLKTNYQVKTQKLEA
jgi:hypothetical protein